ncbi:MAG TPA: chitinase [Bryobacteraceae bacterium]|jgi:chitinase
MRTYVLCFAVVLFPGIKANPAIPTFQYATSKGPATLAGRDPAKGGTTTIPTIVAPVALSFEALKVDGKPFRMDATPDVEPFLRSPIIASFTFPEGGKTQYADALLRATFPKVSNWHTILGKPTVLKTINVKVPVSAGYVLVSHKTRRSVGIADIQFVQREIFKQLAREEGKLVIAVTHNVAFYAEGDATICCSFGTHGSDAATGNSFVLASYLRETPEIIEEKDVQALTEQLAEFVNDPLHDPLLPGRSAPKPGNMFPAWMRPPSMRPGDQGRCAGTGVASAYFLLEPTDVNPKNNFPFSKAFIAPLSGIRYHLQNVALLLWYLGPSVSLGSTFSFPDRQALPEPAKACPPRQERSEGGRTAPPKPSVAAAPRGRGTNGHRLIGYWTGYGPAGSMFPLREISPQWDVIIVAFATPDKSAPEGTMEFHTPAGFGTEEFKSDIAYLKSKGKAVLISLGGGGQHFTLADPKRVPNFVSSVTRIVSEYGFDGIDIDFESPSLSIDPGDTDFRHPTTPSIVNLIGAIRQLHEHFGPKFAITLVPEGTQIPAGYPSYGGQFGSYLPIAYGIRDILTFIDVQDYNTPPLEGLDGEIYQAGTVDYHAAMTELLMHGFPVGGDAKKFFPGIPSNKVAIGFLTGNTTPDVVSKALDYVITGRASADATYRLREAAGYPGMIGAMFWTIDADRRGNYKFSNIVGPQLHGYQVH